MEKRGQGLSTNAIILIILGVVVLIVLILGFTMGWDKIAPWLTTNNVQKVVDSCGIACSMSSTYDFCNVSRTIKDVGNEFKGTCRTLSFEQENYGIEICSLIDCPVTKYAWVDNEKVCLDKGGTISAGKECTAGVTGKTSCGN